ncbi:hypothetical protein UNSWDHB_822 [Dehalobacter sp. UNSWDHB]|nr:hypothetical protein UNSWDHB_822 [Dehalobacter sp. UNSWDHB]
MIVRRIQNFLKINSKQRKLDFVRLSLLLCLAEGKLHFYELKRSVFLWLHVVVSFFL